MDDVLSAKQKASTSSLVLAASALRLRSGDGVDLTGSEGHHGIESKTEQFRPRNRDGEAL